MEPESGYEIIENCEMICTTHFSIPNFLESTLACHAVPRMW